MRDRLLFVVAVLLYVIALGACSWLPNSPTPNTTVIQTVTVGTPQASPSPGTQGCDPTSIVLGTGGDDATLTADGVDDIVLVPSYYQGIVELPAACTANLVPVYTITGPCVLVGGTPARITASAPGSCTARAGLGSVLSNTVGVTAVP